MNPLIGVSLDPESISRTMNLSQNITLHVQSRSEKQTEITVAQIAKLKYHKTCGTRGTLLYMDTARFVS